MKLGFHVNLQTIQFQGIIKIDGLTYVQIFLSAITYIPENIMLDSHYLEEERSVL